ncbi:MAG: prepilin peptidase [Lachnospiraceae bacterium]|nr:prepilin peptidase [Lachnospiraceae bacterium]
MKEKDELMVQNIGAGIMLAINSIWDIREKGIPGRLLLLEVISGMVLIAANREIAWGKDWYLYVFGSLIGMVLLLAGKFSGGCIGMADGIIIALLGGMFGYPDTLLLLMYAILIAAGFSILLIVLKKAGRKTTIPFFPFLLLGYLLVFIRK